MKKINNIILAITILFSAICLAGCQKEEAKTTGTFSYLDYEKVDSEDYNQNLYYLNELKFEVADPTVVYVTEGEEAGWFYAYGTSDLIQCHGFQCWKSKDLTNWEYAGIAYEPDFENTWGFNNYWAPEVIYDAEYKLYFMFFNAENINDGNRQTMSVAYSENPYGPFIHPDNQKDYNGKMLSASQPVFDFTSNNSEIPSNVTPRRDTIDASPFIDPVTGERYLYFSYFENKQDIFGVKMLDWFTPDYSTLTQITSVFYKTPAETEEIDEGRGTATVNEGPFVYYRNGKYYMTFSVYAYTQPLYQVRIAISSSPLGTFEKIDPDKQGTIISTEPMWDHITSAGHHCFVQVGEELYIAYHTFLNRNDISNGRALAVDKIEFIRNSDGIEVMHANGPSYSYQPLPEAISGYKNVASDATITTTNMAEGSNVDYLNDGLVKYHDSDGVTEYSANQGVSTIKLSFADYTNIRSIMIYNSYFYDSSFAYIASVSLEYLNASSKSSTIILQNIPFDYDWHAKITGSTFMHPGGTSIVEFAELPVKSITITINYEYAGNLNLSEIVVLGNNSATSPVKEFSEYSYTNPTYGPVVATKEGTIIGNNTQYNTTWGYDLTNDDGTENGYIVQKGPSDQFAYFKDVFTNTFYAEASITVSASKSFTNDLYPKFGMVVRNYNSCMFFYVDATNNYTTQRVGRTESVYGQSGTWDWDGTEVTKGVTISYTKGNYVKLAIARVGAKFYLYCNDILVFESSSFRGLGANDAAGVGFLSFNTGMTIKDYSVITSEADVNNKINSLNN